METCLSLFQPVTEESLKNNRWAARVDKQGAFIAHRQVINRILELFADAYFLQWSKNKDPDDCSSQGHCCVDFPCSLVEDKSIPETAYAAADSVSASVGANIDTVALRQPMWCLGSRNSFQPHYAEHLTSCSLQEGHRETERESERDTFVLSGDFCRQGRQVALCLDDSDGVRGKHAKGCQTTPQPGIAQSRRAAVSALRRRRRSSRSRLAPVLRGCQEGAPRPVPACLTEVMGRLGQVGGRPKSPCSPCRSLCC